MYAIRSYYDRKHERDLKLGVGGIREIEFFAQAHQLIYGGKNPDLRRRGTVETLRALAGSGIISRRESQMLVGAYGFLRSLEHRIQVYQDRQTHVLPQKEGDLLRLARTMGLPDGPALLAEMDRHTGNVRTVYDSLVITSYSIHYTKLYESSAAPRKTPSYRCLPLATRRAGCIRDCGPCR